MKAWVVGGVLWFASHIGTLLMIAVHGCRGLVGEKGSYIIDREGSRASKTESKTGCMDKKKHKVTDFWARDSITPTVGFQPFSSTGTSNTMIRRRNTAPGQAWIIRPLSKEELSLRETVENCAPLRTVRLRKHRSWRCTPWTIGQIRASHYVRSEYEDKPAAEVL